MYVLESSYNWHRCLHVSHLWLVIKNIQAVTGEEGRGVGFLFKSLVAGEMDVRLEQVKW